MDKWKSVFKTASGVFAIIPGIGILLTNVGVPPGCSKVMFSGVVESLGVFTLLILRFNSEKIKSFIDSTINRLTISSILIFLLSFFLYLFLYNEYIVTYKSSDPLFFPIWPKGELAQGLDKLGSKINLIEEWGRDDVFTVIQSSSSSMLTLTMLLLLFIYQLIFVALTFAFGMMALRISGMKEND